MQALAGMPVYNASACKCVCIRNTLNHSLTNALTHECTHSLTRLLMVCVTSRPRLRRRGDGRLAMALCALQYVWPDTGMLRARLGACLVLVAAERAINLAAPIAFKNMVQVLSDAATDSIGGADSRAAAGAALASVRRTLLAVLGWADGMSAVGGDVLLMQQQQQQPVAAAAAAAAAATTTIMSGSTDTGVSGVGIAFWSLFCPWAIVYLAAVLLRGGSGSEGLLSALRDVLYIPITQVC
jgi:hypothetical protein